MGIVAQQLPQGMMALSEAAALAHRHVFHGTLTKSADALDVIATALSGHLAIFGVRDPRAGLTQLTEEDYSRGAFRHGATRFEPREGMAIVSLAVRKADFERMLKTLRPPRGDPA
jgi:hypothetical protein